MRNLPPVTKNLLIITIIAYFADFVFSRQGIDFTSIFGLHYITASQFHIWQPITYMFMHANFGHIFCNMFAVLMFGPALENRWGSNRFLIYYMFTGIGAAVVQEVVWALQLQPLLSSLDPLMAAQIVNRFITIGASGAVFGILFAFGWLFPDVRMFILFIPIPIRARVLVFLYAFFELFAGLAPSAGDNVAHFAHLGGMLFGWFLLLWWRYRGYEGCSAPPIDWYGIKRWFVNIWEQFSRWLKQLFGKYFPRRYDRIKRDKDDNNYRDFHYHKPL